MANDEHVALLKAGVAAWNEWRLQNADTCPDLRQASLIEAILGEANLTGAYSAGRSSGARPWPAKARREAVRRGPNPGLGFGARVRGSGKLGPGLRESIPRPPPPTPDQGRSMGGLLNPGKWPSGRPPEGGGGQAGRFGSIPTLSPNPQSLRFCPIFGAGQLAPEGSETRVTQWSSRVVCMKFASFLNTQRSLPIMKAGTALRLVEPVDVTRIRRTPLRKPNALLRSREHLLESEIEKLLAAARRHRHGHRDATMLLVAFRHGLRAAELVSLEWSQVDFRSATLHVRRVKKGTPATHPLPADELRALRRLQREQDPSRRSCSRQSAEAHRSPRPASPA
jgi:hypothetical protein